MKDIDIKREIETQMPGAQAMVQDLTGTSDHFQVVVIAPAFEGKSMLEQHRLVKGIFDNHIQTGELHALSLKTYTPEQWAKHGG
jgi:acid stress-induced BolA-like protein IbaG/YrbA